METKYNVGYVLNSDMCSLSTVSLLPVPAFGEGDGRFSLEERDIVVNFIGNYDVPMFNDNFDGWEQFKAKLNEEIYNLFKK